MHLREVVERVEVAGDEVDALRKLQGGERLPQEDGVGRARPRTGDPEHALRLVDRVDPRALSGQVGGSEPGAAGHVTCRVRGDGVPVGQALEVLAPALERRAADQLVVHDGKLPVWLQLLLDHRQVTHASLCLG